MCYCFFLVLFFSGFAFRNCGQNLTGGLREKKTTTKKTKKKKTCGIMSCGMNNLEVDWSLCSALMYSFVVDWAQSTS